MKERMSGRWLLDRSTLDYVVDKLGRMPNCSVLSAMHQFEHDMDRWLKQLEEKKRVY